ncbi:MAG TPA: STAS domain-containing protein [Spirochaetota bacterium]|nr:STAS domain-containing protein [Spirochaetota bacterium]HPJ36420.1 STAS domain-containing protein [Spirochaetota bacterium]
MNTRYTVKDKVVIVYLKGRLDMLCSAGVEHDITQIIERERSSDFLFNMEEVEYINSIGLRVLFNSFLKLKNQERRLAFCNFNSTVKKVFEAVGSSEMFNTFNSEKQGIKYLL